MALTASLRSDQRWLLAQVRRPVASLDSSAAVTLPPDEQRIAGGEQEAAERLGIYRHGYFARLVECLADDYPAVRHVLGNEAFEALCLDFIEDNPSRSPSLNYYGAPFAAHCRGRDQRHAPFVSDLAKLEWAMVEAVHAESRPELSNLHELGALDLASVRLEPNPSLRLLRFESDVGEFYQSFMELGADLAFTEPGPSGASWLAVCRAGDRIWRVGVATELAPLLQELLGGEALGAALEHALSETSASAEQVQTTFSRWVSCGFFSRVKFG